LAKTLHALLRQALPALPLPAQNPYLTGITADSRQVQPGMLFVAFRGVAVDSHGFIPDAIRRGAAAIVGEQLLTDLPRPYLPVENGRAALAQLAAAWYDFPARDLLVIGVTGTDGKTTTATLLDYILRAAGYRSGRITTTGAQIGDRSLDTGLHVTTPDAPDVQRYLAEMRDAGVQAVVLESTSHGLDQRRVDACDFDAAVITNVTHEHLDYHGSWEAYMAAKARLFRLLTAAPAKSWPKVAVLNRDDRSFLFLDGLAPENQWSYGWHDDADLYPLSVRYRPAGTDLRLHTPWGDLVLHSRLLADFNVENVMAAATVALGLGLSPTAVAAGVAAFPGVEGRLQRVDRGQDFLAIVDFAHSPVSLRRVLRAGRALAGERGRLLVVFGSAGLRDHAKRRLMGEAAGELADLIFLTAEDPRTESLADILAAMAGGVAARGRQEGVDFWRIPDRQGAIMAAVDKARPGDVLLVCGKGHERSLCFGETEYPWYDPEALAYALDCRLAPERCGERPYALPTH